MSQTPTAISPDEAIRQLALDIHLLDELREANNKFNIFKVLKIDQYEIRHSQMLAWLFDPQENHGFGDTFLRNFLREVFKARSIENMNLKSSIDENILLSNLDGFIVETEVSTIDYSNSKNNNRRMDIVLTMENSHFENIKIVIENKINAGGRRRPIRQLLYLYYTYL